MDKSLVALKKQAAVSYRYWHIVLERHKRILQHRLQDTTTSALLSASELQAALAILQRAGFPALPATISGVQLKSVSIRFSGEVFFTTHPADELQLLLCLHTLPSGEQQSSEILAVNQEHAAYLQQAAQRFNACLDTTAISDLYLAARLWSALHKSHALPFKTRDLPLSRPDQLEAMPVLNEGNLSSQALPQKEKLAPLNIPVKVKMALNDIELPSADEDWQ